MVAEEGLQNVWRRHQMCADQLHEGRKRRRRRKSKLGSLYASFPDLTIRGYADECGGSNQVAVEINGGIIRVVVSY